MLPILFAAGVLIIGTGLAYSIKRFSFGDSTTLIALMIIPLLAYGIGSGKISELAGPGGWGAKFKQEAEKTIVPVGHIKVSGDLYGKGGLDDLRRIVGNLGLGQPIAVSLQLGRGDYYRADIIAKYISVLVHYDPNLLIIIADSGGAYIASARADVILSQLTDKDDYEQSPVPLFNAKPFIDAIHGTDPAPVRSLYGFSDQSIPETANNVAALQRMQELNTPRLVAVTSDRKPKGLVDRDPIVTQLLLGLVPAQ
ncbi:hypothetical protein [Mesorhizobium qingshengii]|uniref:Uncharacterized protein n=1 Tax=Mesorhizobium qingshengii TaxID=1165689 RepID=A0A1G5V7T1_9HYPH|nr:hypothetical protein [Mesorhizobium qingshengii]SDA41894.1 hypothetical protein SAMN02927914_00377 [Mesorhizobium qingshengii]